jgi:hypothetical protein
VAKLPSVTSPLPRDLQQFVQRVREALDGSGPDSAVTARQLIAAGIASTGTNGGIAANPGTVDTPRAPRNVTTAGALATIIVSWESANYNGHSYAEVWAASRTDAQAAATPPEDPVIDQAQLVGMTAGNNFSHNIGAGAQRWYWVRFINQNGVAGPYNLTDGTFGQTSVDPEYVLEVLTDAVTSSQLASTLLANINTTFSQSSAPSQKADGSALVAGDLWYDTDDGNKLYRYDGTQWVNAQDGGIAQAITAAGGAQGTADGKITTYYQDASPSNSQGTLSEGDLWVDTDDGNNLYRWDSTGGSNGTGAWIDIQDTGIGTAIQDASDAQSTADKKTITFFQDDAPTTTDDAELGEGDLWIDTNDNNKLYRYQYVTVEGQQELDWVTVRDAGIQSALDNAATAQSTADGKILTFYQDDAPTTNDNADLGLGDIWFDTDDGRKMYRYQVTGQDSNGDDVYEWVAIPDAAIAQAIQDAADAQSTADGKITSYYQDDPPTNNNGELSEGDLWTDTDDDDATYRWDDDGGQNGTGEWVRIGLASFTDVNTAITDQVGYCELTIGSGSSAVKSVSTANTTQTLCQAAQADPNKPSNYTYAWKSDGAIASELKTVTSSVNGNTASIQENISSIDGLEAQYTVKIDNNGHVSGFGLASQVAGDSAVSEFMVAADRFSVVNPSSSMEQIFNSYASSTSGNRYIRATGLSGSSITAGVDTLTITGIGDGYDGTYSIVGAGNTSLSGVSIGYAVQISGVPSGFPSNSVYSSTDDFIAAYPVAKAGLNVETQVPFVIATGSTQINGVTVPAGTYINSAMIADATIKNAQINDLTADKITASLLNTVDFYGNVIAGSTIYLGGTVTYTTDSNNNNIGIASVSSPNAVMNSNGATFNVSAFKIDNPGGTDTAPFQIVNDVVYINSAQIKDGDITNAKIGDVIQSTSYTAGSDGWKIDKAGDIELNDATFRGSIDIVGSANTNRLNISGDTIEVIDSNNVTRVKIGDLS